jgi:hypothetical protein
MELSVMLISRTASGVAYLSLCDPAYFARVRVDSQAGTIAWPNGIDLAPETLYDEARRNPAEPTASAR